MRQDLRSLLLAAALMAPAAAQAQPVGTTRRILPELRVDASTGTVDILHFGGGFHVNSGTYMRLALLGGLGRAWTAGQSATSYRFELQGRFHLDPARTSRFGLYGIGGITARHDDFSDWQSLIVAGAGIELPAYAHATLALEVALAGGFRFSVLTRRLTLGRR